jgi:cell division protein FtsB
MDFRIRRQTGKNTGRELIEAAHDAGRAGSRLLDRWGEPLLRWRRRLVTGAMCLLAVWLAFGVISGPNGWMAYRHKRIENRQLQQEIDQLEKDNDELEQHVAKLKNDPVTIEKEAREQLRYAKPGEIIYMRPEQKPQVVQPPATATAENSKQ